MTNNSNKQIAQIDKKEKIIFAAKHIFAEKGFAGARMSDIAKRAGANQALLHYYFTSKENLYSAVLHRLFSFKQGKKIEDYMKNLDVSPPEKLYRAIYLLTNIHIEGFDDDSRKILAREMGEKHPQFVAALREYLIPRYELLEQIIKDGISSGDFATKNSFLVVIGLNTFVITYINYQTIFEGTEWHDRLYGKRKKEELFEFIVDYIFKALRPSNKNLKIPKVDPSIIQDLDSMIEELKRYNQQYDKL